MKSSFKEFMTHLNKEVEAYEALKGILEEEREALIQWDLDAATLALFKKEEVISRIQELETGRTNACLKVGAELFPEQGSDTPPTISEIIGKAGAAEAKELSAVRDRQKDLVNSVRSLNARNSLLMKRTMELIRGSLNVLTEGEGTPLTYDENGRHLKDMATSRLIDGTI